MLLRLSGLIPALTVLAALALMLNQSFLPIGTGQKFAWVLGSGRWVPLALLAASAAARVGLSRQLPRSIQWFDWLAAAFIALAFASSAYSIAPDQTVGRAASVLLLYGAVFWGMWPDGVLVTPNRLAWALVHAIAIVLAVNLIIGPFLLPFDPAGRFQGVMSPNTLGILVALMLPLALWADHERPGWLYRTMGLTMLALIVLCQSRTGAFATVASVSYFLLYRYPHRRRFILTFAATALLLTVLVPQIIWIAREIPARRADRMAKEEQVRTTERRLREAELELKRQQGGDGAPPVGRPFTGRHPERSIEQLRDRVTRAREAHDEARSQFENAEPQLTLLNTLNLAANPRSVDLNTASGRTVVWRLGLEYLAERPWQGFGFGTEELVLESKGFKPGPSVFFGSYFHNSFLGLALQVGIPGMLMFYLPLAVLAWREWRVPATLAADPLRVALRAVFLSGLVVSCFESWLYSMGNALSFPFWTCIMLLAWMHRDVEAS